jgi:short subunit dehydrogenase-like uncharacterized protein
MVKKVPSIYTKQFQKTKGWSDYAVRQSSNLGQAFPVPGLTANVNTIERLNMVERLGYNPITQWQARDNRNLADNAPTWYPNA